MWDKSCLSRNWRPLKDAIITHGLRNSLLVAPMPTASTSQIMGNNDAFEPFTSNMYVRRTMSGEFIVVNKHLMKELVNRSLWNAEMKDMLLRDNGSVQNMPLPQHIKEVYKTVWEMKMKDIIDMAADRGRFIDQSQSMNLFMETPTVSKISSMHMYAWKQGLKTGMYYLRTKSAASAIKFTLAAENPIAPTCRKEADCIMCSA
jgi:ribonucleoside-diphosphate reductase alpha chain